MDKLFSLVWLVSLVAFIVYWRKKASARKAAGENYQSDPEYLAVSKTKRIIGIVCIVSFIATGALAPKPDTSSSTNTTTTSTASQSVKPTEQKKPKTLQQQGLEDKNATISQRNALKKAILYAETMHMSKAKVYEQLTSEYGEKFPEADAQWAIEYLSNIDWNKQALLKAQSYQQQMAMSLDSIREQLVSEAGEQFTPEEAEYAISHLEK